MRLCQTDGHLIMFHSAGGDGSKGGRSLVKADLQISWRIMMCLPHHQMSNYFLTTKCLTTKFLTTKCPTTTISFAFSLSSSPPGPFSIVKIEFIKSTAIIISVTILNLNSWIFTMFFCNHCHDLVIGIIWSDDHCQHCTDDCQSLAFAYLSNFSLIESFGSAANGEQNNHQHDNYHHHKMKTNQSSR